MTEVKRSVELKPSFEDEYPDPDGVELDPRGARLYDTGQRSSGSAFGVWSVTARELQPADMMPSSETPQISLFNPEDLSR